MANIKSVPPRSEETETDKLSKLAWVQCENPECLKWRRITRDEAEILGEDDPWYCSMNSDILHNNCDDEEEDYRSEEKMIQAFGMKFAESCMCECTLVWAKMDGYCKWPGILCKDTEYGQYVIQDTDGSPLSYHVEFLGKAHSHNWIPCRNIELYGFTDKTMFEAKPSVNKIKSAGKRRSKSGIIKKTPRIQKQNYKQGAVEDAIMEANDLLKKTPSNRRAALKFTLDDSDPEEAEDYDAYNFADSPSHIITPKSCYSSPKKTVSSPKTPISKTQSSNKKKSEISSKEPKKVTQKRKSVSQSAPSDNTDSKPSKHKKLSPNEKLSNNKNSKTNSVNTSNQFKSNECIDIPDYLTPDSPNSDAPCSPLSDISSRGNIVNKQLNESVSLINHSKEEKFQLDIEMYRNNERAFEHDVIRFMKRNSQTIRENPVWQNVPVSLFELFLAVYERGGYEQVTRSSRGGWNSIYKEVTGVHKSGGQVAKSFYYKNLLPYELYISGQEYAEYFKSENEKKLPASKNESAIASKKHESNIYDSESSGKDSDSEGGLYIDEESSYGQDGKQKSINKKLKKDKNQKPSKNDKNDKFTPPFKEQKDQYYDSDESDDDDDDQLIRHEMKTLSSEINNLMHLKR